MTQPPPPLLRLVPSLRSRDILDGVSPLYSTADDALFEAALALTAGDAAAHALIKRRRLAVDPWDEALTVQAGGGSSAAALAHAETPRTASAAAAAAACEPAAAVGGGGAAPLEAARASLTAAYAELNVMLNLLALLRGGGSSASDGSAAPAPLFERGAVVGSLPPAAWF
jgi:hypothetical protein